MPHWGWRTFILVMYIGVIVVACTTSQNFTPIPSTELPPLTLTLRISNNLSPPDTTLTPLITTPEWLIPATPFHYVLSEDETLDDILNRFELSKEQLQVENSYVDLYLLRAGYPVLIPQPLATPFPQSFTISQPLCTITNSDTLYCLGTVKNITDVTLQHLALRLYMLDENQNIIDERTIDLIQRDVYPDDIAPYHVFLPLDAPIHQLMFMPARAVAGDLAGPKVTITEQVVTITDSQYQLKAFLDVPALSHSQRIRAVLTVYDRQDLPINYAVHDVSGDAPMLEMNVLLPDSLRPYTHRLHLEIYTGAVD